MSEVETKKFFRKKLVKGKLEVEYDSEYTQVTIRQRQNRVYSSWGVSYLAFEKKDLPKLIQMLTELNEAIKKP